MRSYLDLLARIMDRGVTVQTGATLNGEDRQPTARRLHGEQLVFDLAQGFPVVTTKPVWWRAVVAEWIWFLRGSGDGQYLIDQKVDSIWKAWFKGGTTNLGPVYGRQMRRYQGVKWVDQLPSTTELHAKGILLASDKRSLTYWLAGVVYRIRECTVECVHGQVVEVDQIAQARDDIRAVIADPFNRARRRIIVTLWNPAQIEAMALPPCHTLHAYDMVPPVGGDDARWTLNLHLWARSIDAVKGLPFNIASYALMLSVMARITGCKPGTLTITFNDVHIYDNQFADIEEQLLREPYPLPRLRFDDRFDGACKDLTIDETMQLEPSMFRLENYRHHCKLESESEVAV